MNTLFSNQAFDTAIIALIVALTAFVRQRVSEAKQGAQIESVQNQQQKTPQTIVTVPPPSTGPLVAASVRCPQCGGQVHLDSLAPAPEQP